MQVAFLACLAVLVLAPAVRAQGCASKISHGKGVGGSLGSEQTVGNTNNFEECVLLVQKTNPLANGVSWSKEQAGHCMAEVSQVETLPIDGKDWKNCYITPRPAGCSTPVFGSIGVSDMVETLGNTSFFASCVTMVKEQRPSANGVTWSKSRNGVCIAEYGQTARTSSESWENCFITPTPLGCIATSTNADGAGSPEEKVGNTRTFHECVSMVLEKKPTANGATWKRIKYEDHPGEVHPKDIQLLQAGYCYAELDQSSQNPSTEWVNCYVHPKGWKP